MTTDTRTRADMCPGVWRPWQADDGLLVRIRLMGGLLPTAALRRLSEVSQQSCRRSYLPDPARQSAIARIAR